MLVEPSRKSQGSSGDSRSPASDYHLTRFLGLRPGGKGSLDQRWPQDNQDLRRTKSHFVPNTVLCPTPSNGIRSGIRYGAPGR